MAMFRYACLKQGVDAASILIENAGNAGEMDAAFRAGRGEYIHQQGPAPQQLEHDGVGHVVTALGEAIGPCAFSSLATTRDWLGTDMAASFMRAYRKARQWINTAPAAEIAKVEKSHFPDIDEAVLTRTIKAYQALGCWSEHVEITRQAFQVTLDVFANVGRRVAGDAYRKIVAAPPG